MVYGRISGWNGGPPPRDVETHIAVFRMEGSDVLAEARLDPAGGFVLEGVEASEDPYELRIKADEEVGFSPLSPPVTFTIDQAAVEVVGVADKWPEGMSERAPTWHYCANLSSLTEDQMPKLADYLWTTLGAPGRYKWFYYPGILSNRRKDELPGFPPSDLVVRIAGGGEPPSKGGLTLVWQPITPVP
jgi:hypothetical protein